MKKEQKKRVIEEVMRNFDFEKAHAFMVINDEWFYDDGEKYRPTVEDVKKMARELLEDAFDTRQKYPDFFSTTTPSRRWRPTRTWNSSTIHSHPSDIMHNA